LYVEKSRTDKDGEVYRAVKKCDEEAVEYGKTLLEDYESRMEGDKAGDETITRLRTDLFLNLYLGNELDLLIDEQGKVEYGQYRLDWWKRIDGQSAELDFRSVSQANPNPGRSVTADIAGDIIDKLRSQGIIVKTLPKGKGLTVPRQREPGRRKAASQTSSCEKGEPMAGYASDGDTDEIPDIDDIAAAICQTTDDQPTTARPPALQPTNGRSKVVRSRKSRRGRDGQPSSSFRSMFYLMLDA
jgi:hypothetical protein